MSNRSSRMSASNARRVVELVREAQRADLQDRSRIELGTGRRA
jgi:hypothetical protein